MKLTMSSSRIEGALGWLRGEYLAVPGLALTPPQVAARFDFDVVTAEVVLQALEDSRFLKRAPDGRFIHRQCEDLSDESVTMDRGGAFKNQGAPCGNTVDGERYEDRDEEVMVTEQECYACGCVVTRHEYHDGSVGRKVVHHNGKTLVDELFAAH